MRVGDSGPALPPPEPPPEAPRYMDQEPAIGVRDRVRDRWRTRTGGSGEMSDRNRAKGGAMTTVYVVTSGDYSDYGIEGMFSDRAKADAFAALWPVDGYKQARVEEYRLDVAVDERFGRGLRPFWCVMDRDGRVRSIDQRTPTDTDNPASPRPVPRVGGTWLVGTVWATDKAHAAKILNERRVQLIASGEWPA